MALRTSAVSLCGEVCGYIVKYKMRDLKTKNKILTMLRNIVSLLEPLGRITTIYVMHLLLY